MLKRNIKYSDNEDNSKDSDQKNSHSSRNLRKKIIKPPQPKVIQQQQKIKDLFKKGKYDEIISIFKKDPKCYQEYDEMKFNNHTFKLQQSALIQNQENSKEDYVGKILKIMTVKVDKSNKLLCLCEVKWFYRKSEVIKHAPQHKKWISNQELFSSSSTDIIPAQSIIQPCQILHLKEYEKLESVDQVIFFTRLQFNPNTKKIEGIQSLELMCLCNVPQNPDLGYIQCDGCKRWYHCNCVGVQKHQWENKEYFCGSCR
ncbi:hypothetical protein pb186bvf_004302 [Paramecium bursaria]